MQPERVGAADARPAPASRARSGSTSAAISTTIALASPYGIRPGEGAAPGHPEAAGVVDDDQVGAARLGALGGEPGARAGADDRRRPADLAAQPRERLVAGHRAAVRNASSLSAIAVAKAGSLTSRSSSHELDVAARWLAQGREQRLVGRGVVERPPSRAIIETPPQRDEEGGRAGRARELRADPAAELARTPPAVVRISVTSGCGRTGCGPRTRAGRCRAAPKLTMSSAPSETTCGMPAAPAASSRCGPAREDAADELVAQLGGGQVEHAGDEAGLDRAPPWPARRCRWRGRRAPRSRARSSSLARRASRRGRDAEHGRGDERPLVARARPAAPRDHARHRRGGVGQDPGARRVQPGDVDDRGHHRTSLPPT